MENRMPYKSEAQRKFFHTKTAKKAGITEKDVKEFDKASKGKDLPEKVKKEDKDKKGSPDVHCICHEHLANQSRRGANIKEATKTVDLHSEEGKQEFESEAEKED
jgi:hypothetical protein